MHHPRFRSIIFAASAAALLFATVTEAASVRLKWQHPGVRWYHVYVGQPAEVEPSTSIQLISDYEIDPEELFTATLGGVDPLRPAFFVMTAVDWKGQESAPSKVLAVMPEEFCDAFDIDGNNRLTLSDVLRILQHSVGLESGVNPDAVVSVSDVLEILRLTIGLDCVTQLMG